MDTHIHTALLRDVLGYLANRNSHNPVLLASLDLEPEHKD